MNSAITEISLVVVLAVGATWLAARLKIPSIVLLLAFGVAAGAGLGLLDPDELAGELLIPFVSMAVGLILFEGGLSLRLHEIKGNHRALILLVTVGVAATWGLGALASAYFLDAPTPIAVLLGAILVVSGPTVIAPILRTVRPSRTVASVLKWESIVIDPVGALLAVVVADVILVADLSSVGIAREAARFIFIGVVAGVMVSLPTSVAIRRHVIPERLVPLVGVSAALIAFAVADTFAKESGLLATTVLGLALANNRRLRTEPIIRFSEVVQTLLVGVLFILLSARLTTDDLELISIGVVGVILVLGLVARPLAVAVSSVRSNLSIQERVFLSGVAPRGIVAAGVASVFALELGEAGVDGSELLTPITFAVIVATVLLYGFGAGPLARRLGLAEKSSQGVLIVGAGPVEQKIGEALTDLGFPIVFASTNRGEESRLRLQGYQTYYGNVIEHEIPADLDLAGIGRVLALTPNDEVNTLAARRLTEVFGAGGAYQLCATSLGPGIDNTVADIGGRKLFDESLTYSALLEAFTGGATIRRTTLGDLFSAEDLRNEAGASVYTLFLVRGQQLIVAEAGQKSLLDQARSGDSVLWLASSRPDLN